MEVFLDLLGKLAPLYCLVFVGYIAGKYFRISSTLIAKVLVYVLIPVVTFTGVASIKISLGVISIPILFFLLCWLVSVITYYAAGFFWQGSTRTIVGFAAGSGNTGYIGLPVAIALLGQNVVGIVTLALLGTTLYMNSVGLFRLARGHYTVRDSLVKILKLPVLYAVLLGLLVSKLGIILGESYHSVVSGFTLAYVILGMALIGLALAKIRKYSFDFKFISLALLAKFLLWPALVLALIVIDSHTFELYDPSLHKVLILMAIVPMAANIVTYATLFKVQAEKAAAAVFITTLFSLFYIPIIAALFLQ